MHSRPGEKSAGGPIGPECGDSTPATSPGPRPTRRLYLSDAGLGLGTAFFAISLMPSLLPRPFAVQGLLSGLCFAAGYGAGTTLVSLWRHFQLPAAGPRTLLITRWVLGAACAALLLACARRTVHWQNSVRRLMGMEDLAGFELLLPTLIAAMIFAAILGIARVFRWVGRSIASRLRPHVPPRLARLMAGAAAVLVFWTAIDGILIRSLLAVTDRSFQRLDAWIDDDLPRPTRAEQTGSEASRVSWEDLGRQGRNFIARGPTADDLVRFFGTTTPAPVRVYVGLNSADSVQQRARLALDELIRAGGFDRSLLLLVTPTGTGWIDPASQTAVEYLHRGNIATVAAQYSYLNSPLALLTQSAYGAEMARALFRAVYDHWRHLPRNRRPRLFLNGLSLGSLNSDRSFDFFDIIDEPFDGALWSGPPFRHETWLHATEGRDPGSPAWRPTFRGGSVVRFMNQGGGLSGSTAPWGSFRILFLQYASDPITFFDPHSTWRAPDWMREPRGPDVSSELGWFPVVTLLQLAADMMVGTAPPGFGHQYAASDYIEAWRALTEPPGWTEAELDRLRAELGNGRFME